jgi:hypothetical protein
MRERKVRSWRRRADRAAMAAWAAGKGHLAHPRSPGRPARDPLAYPHPHRAAGSGYRAIGRPSPTSASSAGFRLMIALMNLNSSTMIRAQRQRRRAT